MHIFLEQEYLTKKKEKYLQSHNQKPLVGAKTNISFATD